MDWIKQMNYRLAVSELKVLKKRFDSLSQKGDDLVIEMKKQKLLRQMEFIKERLKNENAQCDDTQFYPSASGTDSSK